MEKYKLEFSGATIPYSENSNVLQSSLLNKAFVISNNTLYEFEFENKSNPIIRTTQDKEYPFENGAKLLYIEPIDDEQTAIMVKVSQGLRIYLHAINTVHLAVEDDQFHDVYDWNKQGNEIFFGHFYDDSSILGLMSSHLKIGTKFFAIFKDVLLSGDFPVYPLDTNTDVLETYSPNSSKQMLSDLKRISKKAIIARNRDGISCFEFNQTNGINFLMKIPHGGSTTPYDGNVFFTDLTHNKYNDIVHFNASGLFIYQYTDNYRFINYNPLFSEKKGWTSDHAKTVRFFDINKDGCADMLFTGPRGIAAITYNQYSNSWNDIIETTSLPPSMRHAQLMQVLPMDEGDDYIFVHLDDSIHWAKVVQLPAKPKLVQETLSMPKAVAARTSLTPPQAVSPTTFQWLPLLRDMNIWSEILNCVGQDTGKPKFTLPLINLQDPSVKLVLQYDSTNTAVDVLGVGWSMPLNLIVMDDNGSIFDEDTVYAIAFQDSMHALKYLPNESTSTIRVYTMPSNNGSTKLRAKFYTKEDQWIVDLGTGVKQLYGQIGSDEKGAISKEIVWKNWHGPGFDSDDQLERSRMWYIAEVRNERGNTVVEFFYDVDEVTVNSGLKYTKAVYIKKSRDYQGNEIEFQYKEKQFNEYKSYDFQDKEGNYNWEPVQTRYLTGYTFATPSRGRQEVILNYITSNGLRFLTEIQQINDVIDSPVVKFEYLTFPKMRFGLKNVLLPFGVEVVFSYAATGESNSTELKRIAVSSDYKVSFGEDYVLVSFIRGKVPGQVVLRMFNRDLSEELYTSDSRVHTTIKGRWPLLGEYSSTVAHEVIQGDDYFGVILFYTASKSLCLFGRTEEPREWLKKTECHKYKEDATIQPGRDFCLVANPGSKLELFEWRSAAGNWHRETFLSGDSIAVAVHKNKFVTYDNKELALCYKTSNGTWSYKPLIDVHNCLSETENTIKRFNLNTANNKLFSSAFRNNALQFSQNLVAVKCLQIKEHKLQSLLRLFTLNRLKEVSDQQEFVIHQDDLDTFVSAEENGKDGNHFQFKYEIKPNGEFYIKVASIRGPILHKISSKAQRSQFEEQIEKSINSPTKRFLLDIQKYLISISDKVIVLNDQRFTFGGTSWKRTALTEKERNPETFSVPMGNHFILDKANKDAAIKLLEKSTRQILSQLTVDMKDLRIFYPIYLATQTKGVPVRLLKFDEEKVNEQILSSSENLSRYTNPMILITHEGGDDSKMVIFREQHGIRHFLPNYVVREVTVVFDNERTKRVTGYEFNADTGKLNGNTVVYSEFTVIPANDRKSYGWLRHSRNEGSSTTAYDNQGQEVRNIPANDENPNEEKELEEDEAFRKATTIYDKSGALEIAQCAPFSLADELVGYFGFEDYEVNSIGKSKQWKFDSSNIIRNGFALTGNNYLHQKTEPVEGIFEPLNQNAEYIASSWIRLQNVTTVLQIGEITPYLKAIVLTASDKEVVSLLSEVKFRLDDWIYLELIVDLPLARNSLNEHLQGKLKVSIRVGPTLTTPVDIDHVRFAPLISDFNVNIFDAYSKLNTAVIKSTGSILRRTYDVYNSIVSTINEQNQIEELTVYTKAAPNFKTLRCTVSVQPEMGFYEQFTPFSFANRWKIAETSPWRIASHQLQHSGAEKHNLELNVQDFATEAYGFRMLYSLLGYHASCIINHTVELSTNSESPELNIGKARKPIPPEGEILLVKEGHRIFIWIDGVLCIDQSSDEFNHPLKFTIRGTVTLRDMMVFSNAGVKVVYQNSLDEPIQEVSLESADCAIVKERLYDELGRQRITTQNVRIERSKFEPLLSFYSHFVTNDGLDQLNSIWKTGILEGLATEVIGHPYAFAETNYAKNPLNEKTSIGLPGKEFSTSGIFAKRFTSKMTNLFVKNRYPLSMNVSYQVELKLGDIEDITVLNSKNKKIAHFVHVPGGKDLFSTYKLNKDGNLLQCLPPIYFERVGSFHKTNSQLLSLDSEDYRLQAKLGIHVDYDENGKPIRKTTPDAGPIENIYDDNKLLRFVLYYSYADPNLLETIVYFTYDEIGRILSAGQFLDLTIPKDRLQGIHLNESNSLQYQSFNYANFERDPMLRGLLQRTITMNGIEPFAEVIYTNEKGDAVNKRIILPNTTKRPDQIIISKQYSGKRLRRITYPGKFLGQTFSVVYGYDRLGRVNSIGTPESPHRFLRIEHNAAGQVIAETFDPASVYTFKLHRDYNEPGYLTMIKSPFQSEEISYTHSSYGGANRGDGSVTRIKFTANWHKVSSSIGIGLTPNSFENDSISLEDSRTCFEALKRAGYLNDNNRQVKAFYPDIEIDFPIICTFGTTGRHISKVLGHHGFPQQYGYRLDYGAHQDLTKAKYFVGSDEPQPFQADTFAKEIPGISIAASSRIWRALREFGFLVEDPDRINISSSHGKESQKNFIGSNLFTDLSEISQAYVSYAVPLRKLLALRYFKRQGNVTQMQLQDHIHKWVGNSSPSFKQRTAADIFEMLRQKRYFFSPLDKDFEHALKEFKDSFPEIVRVLFTYFGRQLGRSEFDVESYEIDSNGNHRMFNTGYDHYGLKYEQDSNRAEGVKYKALDSPRPEEVFAMYHDSRGNVVQALHKGIQSMIYHPVSNLLQRVQMVDGKSVGFYYDSKGERVLKRVADSNGNIVKEIHYLRDDQGRTLVERELSFLAANQPPAVLVTMYIYGTNGLIGFVRRDQFYSVLTDHQGSVRLIVRDGEVVAAYDYLPYGNLMRIFGSDVEAHISYRYTGQEWDSEIGLYNYHARFYDPTLGRFYQTDPKEQYFSPYKYAGNSPISMVDPSGEIAFLLIFALVSMVVGAYLGAASANNEWKFWKWDWLNVDTYLGLFFGGVTGFFLPAGFVGLGVVGVGFSLTLGVVLGYLSAAAANGSADPSDWDFSSPRTFSALFDGFAMGATAISSFRNVGQFYKQLTANGRKLFVASSVVLGTGLFVMGGVSTDWDIKKPQFWFATLTSIASAPDLAMFAANGLKVTKRGWKALKTKQNGRSIRETFSEIFRETHELATVAGIGLTMVSFGVALNHGFGNWSEISTYQNILTAIQVGGQVGVAGKHGIFAMRAKLKLRRANKALKLTEDIAAMASQLYKEHIRDQQTIAKMENNQLVNRRVILRHHSNYNANTISSIRANKIPNTAMTVVVAGKIAIVGFSTDKAPGPYFVYDHDHLTNPRFRTEHIEDNNAYLLGNRVRVRDDAQRSNEIASAIDEIQNAYKQVNRQQYETENLHEIIANRAATNPTVDPEIRNNIVNAIHNQIMENGFVDKVFILQKFDEFNFATAGMRAAKAELELTQTALYAKKNEYNNGIKDPIQRRAGKTELDALQVETKRLNTVYEEVRKLDRKSYSDLLYEPLKPLDNRVTTWGIANCAEPHTLLALERQKQIWGEEFFTPRSYDIHLDIEYMSTFSTRNLKGFQRCDHCMESTKLIKNVLTDDEFMYNLEQSALKAQYRAEEYGKQLQFLQPIINYQKTTDDERKLRKDKERPKRSVEPKWYKNPLKWITRLRSLPDNNRKSSSSKSNKIGSNPILEIGDNFLSKLDVNGTLLLADILLAKCQHRRVHQTSINTAHRVNSAELLCNILQLFDDSIQKAADISGICGSDLNVDTYTMQAEVMSLLRNNDFDALPQVMLNYAMNALDEFGDIADTVIDEFRSAFASLKINESIEELWVRMALTPTNSGDGTDIAYNSSYESKLPWPQSNNFFFKY